MRAVILNIIKGAVQLQILLQIVDSDNIMNYVVVVVFIHLHLLTEIVSQLHIISDWKTTCNKNKRFPFILNETPCNPALVVGHSRYRNHLRLQKSSLSNLKCDIAFKQQFCSFYFRKWKVIKKNTLCFVLFFSFIFLC